MKSYESLQSNESLQAAQSIFASLFDFEAKIDEKFYVQMLGNKANISVIRKFGYDHDTATDITSITTTSCPENAATSSRGRMREVWNSTVGGDFLSVHIVINGSTQIALMAIKLSALVLDWNRGNVRTERSFFNKC